MTLQQSIEQLLECINAGSGASDGAERILRSCYSCSDGHSFTVKDLLRLDDTNLDAAMTVIQHVTQVRYSLDHDVRLHFDDL